MGAESSCEIRRRLSRCKRGLRCRAMSWPSRAIDEAAFYPTERLPSRVVETYVQHGKSAVNETQKAVGLIDIGVR